MSTEISEPSNTHTIVYIIVTIQLLFAVVVASTCDKALAPISKYARERNDDVESIELNVSLILTLCWPLVWGLIVGYDSIYSCAYLIIPFCVPIVLSIIQIFDLHNDQLENVSDHQTRRRHIIGNLHGDSAFLLSIGLGIMTILIALSGKQNTTKPIRILVFTILICVISVTAVNNMLDGNQRFVLYIRAAQRILIYYAIGLVSCVLLFVGLQCQPIQNK